MDAIIRRPRILSSGGGSLGSITTSFDADLLAWVAAVVANGGSVSSARKTVVNSLFVTLKGYGVYGKFDRIWLYAGENEPYALTDLVARDLSTTVNSPSFVVDRGYTGDTSNTMYISTTFNPISDGVQSQNNSAHCSAWVRTPDTTTVSGVVCGSSDGVQELTWFMTGNPDWAWIHPTAVTHFSPNQNGAGWLFGQRESASAGSVQFNAGSKNTSSPSGNIPDREQWALVERGQFGAPGGGANHQVSILTYGGGTFSDADVANTYSAFQAYMNAIGA